MVKVALVVLATGITLYGAQALWAVVVTSRARRNKEG